MDFPLSIWYERNHARRLARAQHTLLIVLEISQAAKAITNLATIGFSLTNSIISSTILQEIKRKQQQAFKNSMYVFVCCLKLNMPNIAIKAHVFVLINRGKILSNFHYSPRPSIHTPTPIPTSVHYFTKFVSSKYDVQKQGRLVHPRVHECFGLEPCLTDTI